MTATLDQFMPDTFPKSDSGRMPPKLIHQNSQTLNVSVQDSPVKPSPLLELSTKERPQMLDSFPDEIRMSRPMKPRVVTIPALLNLLRGTLQERRFNRLAIDSLSSLEMFSSTISESTLEIQSLIRFLSDTDSTVLCTVETPASPPKFHPASFLARGEIHLEKSWNEGHLERHLKVLKFRGTEFSLPSTSFQITDTGIVVSPPPP